MMDLSKYKNQLPVFIIGAFVIGLLVGYLAGYGTAAKKNRYKVTTISKAIYTVEDTKTGVLKECIAGRDKCKVIR